MENKEMDTFKWELNRITRDMTEFVHSYEKLDDSQKTSVHSNYPFELDLHELKNALAKWNNTVNKM
ncbi:hypothetical protein [Guptibacillus algicola]|uniref:hypothetical protein n=1 Tax=Guptibacillus algicola TaxID=225844 RepID=UPI001CD7166D|nr:hypothetical protein [Alkalihalobacillus algicola]MCA0987740.1 hypothetical protein [Alkalihalobacillus algicola]